ncbi:MAG: PDDEXK nuclease domain-containing protein [Spirochaetaceae bacterium]|nr:PDDEXK nuclease domain-containing protein [Spirochaetaceae bacterium]
MTERKSLGRRLAGASIPAPPGREELPTDYRVLLGEIKERIRAERVRVVLAANQAMVLLYWDIGKAILARQEREGWGAGTIDRLSHDLRVAFPDMRGLSPRNLKYMRAFAAAWPEREVVQEVLAQITWYHNIALLEKVDDRTVRLWYAAKAREAGWSRNVLAVQIENRRHERQGNAVTNFPRTLPPADSELATQSFKDPYLFDFLGTAEPRTERELEQGLVDHIQRFLLEMGAGFAFVGRQVLLEVGDSDFRVVLPLPTAPLRRSRTQGGPVQPRLRRPDEPVPLRRGRPDAPPRRRAHYRPAALQRQGPAGGGVRSARPRQTPRRRGLGDPFGRGTSGRSQGQPADH